MNAPPPPLLDPVRDARARPLRDLRISVTDRCNFRCTYCMPEELFGERYRFLPKPEILSFEEIERVTRLFVQAGVRKLRITGGEPLLRQDLPSLIARLAAIPSIEDMALTTNGTLLPRLAQPLRDAGLRRITVSLDSLDPAVFHAMNGGRLSVEGVLAGIEAADAAGLGPVKINCVVQRGVNDHTLIEMAKRFRGTGHVVRFIEFMDVGTRNAWNLDQVVPAREIVARLDEVMPLEPVDRRQASDVAERWRYRDGSGEIGVIASVTRPFCGGCTRARLTTEGQLVTCLFARGGVSLRDPLRVGATDDVLLALIRGIWQGRSDAYSEEREKLAAGQRESGRVEMFRIGG